MMHTLSSVVTEFLDQVTELKQYDYPSYRKNSFLDDDSKSDVGSVQDSEDGSVHGKGSIRSRSSLGESMQFMKKSLGKTFVMHNFREVEKQYLEEGPITDIQLLLRGQKCPVGYRKLFQVGKNQVADLTRGVAGKSVGLCYRRGGGDLAPITGVVLFHEGKDEFVPPGYEIIGTRVSGQFIADISLGTNESGRVFMCVCRGEGPPIVDFCVVQANHLELLPDEYGVIERTPLGYSAVLNSRTKSSACSLAILRDRSHLGMLLSYGVEDPLCDSQGEGSPRVWPLLPGVPLKPAPKGATFRTNLTPEDLASARSALPELGTLMVACYSYNIPCMIIALRYMERVILSGLIDFTPELDIGVALIKCAADCTELGLDILFCPAMKVIVAAIGQSTKGLHPLSIHFISKALARTSSFFKMLPVKLYASTVHHQRPHSHSFDGRRIGDESDETKHNILFELSTLSLEDLNFLLVCPTTVFDLVVRTAAASHTRAPNNTDAGETSAFDFIQDEIIPAILNNVCDMNDVMKVTDDAVKRLACFSSETVDFSQAIHEALCLKLPLNVHQRNAVMFLVWISQATSMRLNVPLRKGKIFNAEWNQKVAMLDLLRELVSITGTGGSFFTGHVFIYQVRRFTFNSIVHNSGDARRVTFVLPILSELWKSSRVHLKIEFAVVLEKIVLMILRDRHTTPSLRGDLLNHTVSWFGMHPGDLVEMFLNFENVPLVKNWKSFESLIETLCSLVDPNPRAFPLDVEEGDAAINREIQYDALASLVTLLRSLTDMSGSLRLKKTGDDKDPPFQEDVLACFREEVSCKTSEPRLSKNCSVRIRHQDRQQDIKILRQAFDISRTSGCHKCIKFLAAQNLLQETPSHIASFLHLYHDELDEREVGKYLGSSTVSGKSEVFMTQVRLEFTRALSFAGRSFEQCLRLFLEDGHFFLPGESQQVGLLLDAFAQCFVSENSNEFDKNDTDMIFLLSFSTVMLNTDLHNPAVQKKKKMTEEQFLKQISHIETGERISSKFGTKLYRSIAKNEIKMKAEKHMEVTPVVSATSPQPLTRADAQTFFQRSLVDAVACVKTILASNSMKWCLYHTKVTIESVRVMFEISWVHFYSVVTRILDNPKTFQLDIVALALDVLGHCICISLFLGMETERKAFATLMAKIHYLYSNKDKIKEQGIQSSVGLAKGQHLKDKWYKDVMEASCESENIIEVISQVHHLTACLKEMVGQRQNYDQLVAIQKRLEGGCCIVQYGRRFVREGVLLKRCRNNKFRKYYFFLFSDILLYASPKTLSTTKFHIHQVLELHTMKVRKTSARLGFEIQHPRKLFAVQALNDLDMHSWIRDIKNEIESVHRAQAFHVIPAASAGKSASFSSSSHSSSDTMETVATPPRRSRFSVVVERSSQMGDDFEEDDDDEDGIHDPKLFECDDDDDDDTFALVDNDGPSRGSAKRRMFNTLPKKQKDALEMEELSTEDNTSWLSSLHDQVGEIDAKVKGMDDGSLHKLFVLALRFAKPILTSTHDQYVATDEQKLLVYGFFKQSTRGDCQGEAPQMEPDWVAYSKFKVWESLQGTPKTVAKQKLLTVMNQIAPGWGDHASPVA
uniref:SEC7 domain-containing protein n=1 Tax=Mucochytrium quahogii TaxID=96639 RepID=A0A7S2RQG1_9STRA|mmetsp:Transcript_45144/g.72193  ORF Transcript_45144/g.72193 Transcript_45144/m.72193 type:complete len:1588 (-) Transcript_45144:2098-6861(-)|eukprot:CAMPEP_0203744854 /NCGR_PEP_ID=MMETSP0098-20131031/786_1 /ASSEMBLY_ACC=CAM_ASM_000208 /TAXON_ID=96639 /ORGANISM=" , Strain NY0313808BC1" /LENGTH=1587 /DNA_ID=CAMNT_0050632479 /DNA_START=561 /DNA_END=5324 /DNA_ORIENTATION=-